MSRKVQVTFSDELYEWISSQAKDCGLAVATFIQMLIVESKKNREMVNMSASLFDFLAKVPPEQLKALLEQKSSYPKELE